MNVGFIGLGIMGSRMARNLMKNGIKVNIYNRTKSKAEDLINEGGVFFYSVQDLCKECDVVFTMLSTPEAVKEIATGESGLLSNLTPNNLWIDCSTVNPEFSKEMSALAKSNNIRFLDAPVSGSKIPAENAQLIFLVGGNEHDLIEVENLLRYMGKAIIYAGENGKGSALKLVINSLLAFSLTGFVESMKLGEAFGFSKQFLLDTLPGLPVTAPLISGKKEKINNEDFSPEFPLQWMLKDIHLAALEAYNNRISLPVLNSVKEVFSNAKFWGYGEEDIIAIIKNYQNSKR